jgi:hypothetical protein
MVQTLLDLDHGFGQFLKHSILVHRTQISDYSGGIKQIDDFHNTTGGQVSGSKSIAGPVFSSS